MLDFTLSETHQNIRDMIHWFAENEMRPLSLAADATGQVPVEFLMKTMMLGISSGAVQDGVDTDVDVGKEKDAKGTPSTNRFGVIASEEMAWGDAAFILTFPGPGLGGPPVRFMGTPEQKKFAFDRFRDHSKPRWGAYALTEPGAGSDVSAIKTSARKDGDYWVLNGTKCYITNGARAEWNVVFATVDATKGREAHRAFLVEKGTPGFRVGKIEKKMGIRASETAELVFEDCRVHKDFLLGGEEYYHGKEGFMGAMKTFDNTRPLVAAMAVGIGRAAYERARDFFKENFMTGRAIARYRAAEDLLAKSKRDLDAARLLVWRAAWMADEGIPNTKEASMSKAYAATAAQRATINAIDVMGAAGCLTDNLVEKWYRDIKVFDIFEGTGQIQRIVIAKRLIEGIKNF